ncbi:hypothetical protein [Methylomonas sp. MgM2]
MTENFTYLWKNEQWNHKVESTIHNSHLLTYAASDKFSKNGVTENSTVFIVSVFGGVLYLGGYIRVFKILNRSQASEYLEVSEKDLWKAKEYIVAEKGSEQVFKFNNVVPDTISHKIEFFKGKGFVNPVIKYGKIDEQTFRNVRRLYIGAEKKLYDQLMLTSGST